MPRPRYPSGAEPLPPPLPPAERTIGQLVAEALRLYGRRFLVALPLGLPLALADQLALDLSRPERVIGLVALAPAFTAAYVGASALAADERPQGSWVTALGVGTLVFLPAALFFPWFALASVAWLGLTGLVVPVALLEPRGWRDSFARALQLGRADYVHAVGSLATLVLLFWLTRIALALVLRAQADNTIRIAVLLADIVLAPLLFLGAALLYYDQAARVRPPGSPRPARRGTARRAG